MSSLGEWLSAMVDLRKAKAQEQEFNASQQYKGMEALGAGFGDLLGGLGKGLGQGGDTRQDILANRMRNESSPPRAMAVNQALQAQADTTIRPGQIPYDVQPMNQGGPAYGGVKGLDIARVLDTQALNQFKADTSRQGMIDRNLNAAGRADTAADRLEEIKRHHLELEAAKRDALDAKTANDLTARAASSMKNSTQKYQDKVKETTSYNNHVALTTHNMATAKTDEDWQKNVDLLTNHYNAITALGYELPFPEIPPSPSQRRAAASATQAAGNLTPQAWNNWWGPSQAAIDAAKADAAAMPGSYQYAGVNNYERADPGAAPSADIETYKAQLGPSQAAQQGPAPSAAAPGAGPKVISLKEARKRFPNVQSNDAITLKNGQQLLVQ